MDPDADTLDLTEALAALREAEGPRGCPWYCRLGIADRLCDGSAALTRRFGDWMVDGDWRTALGHAAIACGAAYAAANLAEQQKMLVPAATIAWCIAAWRTESSVRPNEPLPSCDEHREALLDWLDQITDGRNGIHLAELYERLRERPALAHLDDQALRSALDHYRIPVRRSIRVDGIAGRSGIHRDDLTALLSPPEPEPLSTGGDAGQTSDLHPLSSPGEEVESTP